MPSRTLICGLILSACLGAAAGAAQAQTRPLTPAEGRHQPYTGKVPLCSNQEVTGVISRRFHQRERNYWRSGLVITGYERIRETGLRSSGLDLIPKRYCQAYALMNDGRKRKITYWIGESLGFIGVDWTGPGSGWGVEWCIEGLDHHRAFAPGCQAAEP